MNTLLRKLVALKGVIILLITTITLVVHSMSPQIQEAKTATLFFERNQSSSLSRKQQNDIGDCVRANAIQKSPLNSRYKWRWKWVGPPMFFEQHVWDKISKEHTGFVQENYYLIHITDRINGYAIYTPHEIPEDNILVPREPINNGSWNCCPTGFSTSEQLC